MEKEKNKEEVKKEQASLDIKEKVNIEELKKKLEECEKQKREYLSSWQRERADFLNHKREEMERVEELLKYSNELFILKILTILDNFEIVEQKLPENLKKDENVKGLLMVKSQISDFLKTQGVEAIKSVGEKFDPNFHEAIGQVEVKPSAASAATGKGQESGIIIEEIKKGYRINGRLLRPAKVRVIK